MSTFLIPVSLECQKVQLSTVLKKKFCTTTRLTNTLGLSSNVTQNVNAHFQRRAKASPRAIIQRIAFQIIHKKSTNTVFHHPEHPLPSSN